MPPEAGDQAPDEAALGYGGWRVVGACFVMALFAWGIGFYGHSVYLAEFTLGRGWSSAAVSGATTLYYLVSAAMVAYVGEAIARFGPRTVVLAGAAALAASAAMLAGVSEPWHLVPAYLVMSVGWAALTLAAISNILGLWFQSRRGMALSLALNGASAGGIVGTPVIVWLGATFGFRGAMLAVALLTLAVLVPVALVWIHHPPAGGPGPSTWHEGSEQARPARGAYLRSLHFWSLAAPFALGLAAQVGFIVHQISFLEPRIGRDGAALAVAVTTAMAVVGRVGIGFWIDRLDQRAVSAVSLASQAVALFWMAVTESPAALIAASALFGLSVGNLITLPVLIVQREFPAVAFGMVTALVVAINQVTYAFGPGVLGVLRDWTGGYGAPLTLCMAMQCAGALIVLLGRPLALRQNAEPRRQKP
jgi:predicted MFS family arabinose efflux permease